MAKEEIINCDIMRILARMSYEEHLDTKKFIKRWTGSENYLENDEELYEPHIKDINDLGLKIGVMNSMLKGLIIGPELLFLKKKYSKGTKNVQSFDNIYEEHGSLYNFLKDVVPDDLAISIGANGIAHSLYLDGVVEGATEVLGKNIDEIVNMYLGDVKKIGARTKVSVASAVLLNKQNELEGDDSDLSFRLEADPNNEPFSYDGRVCFKTQTITNNAFTSPITLFSKYELYASAAFCLKRVVDCSAGLVTKYLTQKKTIKQEYLFDKGLVGVLTLHFYDGGKEERETDNAYLIKPSEIGLKITF